METAEATYGSDRHGVVWGFLLNPQWESIPVDAIQAAAWLAASPDEEDPSYLWLHFSLSNAGSIRWMRQHLDLPEGFYEIIAGDSGSTRVEQTDEALVAVIHDVLFDFTFEGADASVVSLCAQPRVMVSARVKPLRSLDQLRSSVKAGRTFLSTADLLAQLLREQADVLIGIIRRAATQVDAIEDTLLDNRISTMRRELGALRRALVRLQRLLAPEPAALFRLLNRPPSWIRSEDRQALREAAEEFAVSVTDSAALVERVKLLQEELAALVNEQANRTLFVLTMVTVLALPINLVAGLFGMNVRGVPFAEVAGGFWIVVGVLATMTAVLGRLALHRYRD